MSAPTPIKVTTTKETAEEGKDSHRLCVSSCFLNCCGRPVSKVEVQDNSTSQKTVKVYKDKNSNCCNVL